MIAAVASILSLAPGAVGLPPAMGVDGKLHWPLAEAHGKPVAFIFISHDCPVCNIYAPEIGRIESKYGQRIDIDIVYSESGLSRAHAVKHAKEFAIGNGTLLLDASRQFAAACGAHFTPEAIVFDSSARPLYDGRIDNRFLSLGRQLPAPTTHDLTLALDAILAHQTPKAASGPPVGCFIILPHKT